MVWCVVWVVVAGGGAVVSAEEADLILHHGKIVTVDAQSRIVEAMAVKGDKILAVGSNGEIQKLAGKGTTQVDLKGKTVLPGLMDSHVHPTGAAMFEYDHPLPEFETIGDVLKYVEQRTKVVPEGEWISMSQVFITRLRDQRYPTRKELDSVAPKHPVLFATGPDASINSLAMKLSGIDRDTKIAAGKAGRIEKDADGEPTGILRSCTYLVKSKSSSKSATEAERYERLKQLFAAYNAVGITSVSDRNCSDGAVKMYQTLRDRGELTCRMFIALGVDGNSSPENLEKRIQAAAQHPLHKKDDMLWLRAVKVFLDGGMLTGSAYMRQPWGVSTIYSITDPQYKGLQYISDERLRVLARLCAKNDLQMMAHSQGDAAVHALVEAFVAVDPEVSIRDKRMCITHSSFMSREIIEKMKAYGVVADLQPAWLWLDGQTLEKQFGNERMRYFHPYKTLADLGVIVGGGSDHMQKIGSVRSVNPYNPFLGMWITLSRVPRRATEPLHPEERITREQAIRLYTINNAYIMFAEEEKGSLEPKKLADFIVLKQDILTCPLDEIREIEVERTYLGGKVVYDHMQKTGVAK